MPRLGASVGDCLPALMMAGKKGKSYDNITNY